MSRAVPEVLSKSWLRVPIGHQCVCWRNLEEGRFVVLSIMVVAGWAALGTGSAPWTGRVG